MSKRSAPDKIHVGLLDRYIFKGVTREDVERQGGKSVLQEHPVSEAGTGAEKKAKTKKKKKKSKKKAKSLVEIEEDFVAKRPNDSANLDSVTMLSFVQLLLRRTGSRAPTKAIFNDCLKTALREMSERGAVATFGENNRVQSKILLNHSTARRWWKKYNKAESCGDEWEEILNAVVEDPEDGRAVETELLGALFKNACAGRKSSLSEETAKELELMAEIATTSSEGLHYHRLISFLQYLLAKNKETPTNKKGVPYAHGRDWAKSWLRRRDYVLRLKTNSTGKVLGPKVLEEHLERGAVLVALLNIKPENVFGLDEVPVKLAHSSGPTLAREGAREVLGGTKEKDQKAQLTVVSIGSYTGVAGIGQFIAKGLTFRSCPVGLPTDVKFDLADRYPYLTPKGNVRFKDFIRHPLDDSHVDRLKEKLEDGSIPIPFAGIEHDADASKRCILLSFSQNHWMYPLNMWELVVLNVLARKIVLDRVWHAARGTGESPEWMLLEMDDWYAHRNASLIEWLYCHRVAVNPIPPNGTNKLQSGDLGAHAPFKLVLDKAFQASYNRDFSAAMFEVQRRSSEVGEGFDIRTAMEEATERVAEKHSGQTAQKLVLLDMVREAFYNTIGPGYKVGFAKAGKKCYFDPEFQQKALANRKVSFSDDAFTQAGIEVLKSADTAAQATLATSYNAHLAGLIMEAEVAYEEDHPIPFVAPTADRVLGAAAVTPQVDLTEVPQVVMQPSRPQRQNVFPQPMLMSLAGVSLVGKCSKCDGSFAMTLFGAGGSSITCCICKKMFHINTCRPNELRSSSRWTCGCSVIS